MIKVITTKESLLDFKDYWNALYSKCHNISPFQKFSYIANAIDFSFDNKNQLYIITVRDAQAKEWVAIFPLYIDNSGTLRYINFLHTDFCLPLIHPSFANFNLIREVADYIKNDKNVKGIVCDNVIADDFIVGSFKAEFSLFIAYSQNYYSEVQIEKSLTDKDSVDAFRSVPSKRKGKLRQIIKKNNNNCRFEIFSVIKQQPYPSKSIDALAKRMISSGIRTKDYLSDKMFSFWEKLYNTGVVDIAVMYEDSVEVACSFLLVNETKHEYIEWIVLYVDKSWNVALCLQIEDYLYRTERLSVFNFARGIYDYKLVNFHPDVKPLFRVMIAKTKWGHFKNIISTAFHYSKPIVKSWLGR